MTKREVGLACSLLLGASLLVLGAAMLSTVGAVLLAGALTAVLGFVFFGEVS